MPRKGALRKDEVWELENRLQMARCEQAPDDTIHLLEVQLERARREQTRLVEYLAHHHAGALRKMAARMFGRDHGDDIAQNAFFSLQKRLTTCPLTEARELLESPAKLQNLMCRITVFRGYDFLRERGRHGELVTEPSEIEDTVDSATWSHPETAIALRRLAEAYDSLPRPQRVAHILHHYYGFTDTDFETLGLSKTNSRTLVYRANRKLKRAMEVNE